jgi:hypothetical protein
MLAFYLYPFEPNQKAREYTEEDLKDPKIVEELFDYCQINEACITKDGWELLTRYHGYEQLYEIDKRSGWFDEDTIEAFKKAVQQEIEDSIDS